MIRPKVRTFLPLSVIALGLWPIACEGDSSYFDIQNNYIVQPDAGVDDPGPVTPSEPDAGPDGGPAVIADGVPPVDTLPEQLALDVYGSVGAHYWFVATPEQIRRMNDEQGRGGPIEGPIDGDNGDIYTPNGGIGGTGATFVEHLVVTTAGDDPHTADFGKVQVKLVGESTGRPWTLETLPNFKIDADEFDEGKHIGNVKHFRLNNAVVGNIYREKLTLDLYRELGYPAPRATYAWVSGSVWGPEKKIPYVLVESYKPQFCKFREADLAGGCRNMWEFPGDIGSFGFEHAQNCQFNACDNTNVVAFEQRVLATASQVQEQDGEGFKEALADAFDWDAFHKFQCLAWILATGDDVLHNGNNMVLAEREDGKFQYFPYSVDISLGQSWYRNVSLGGSSTMAQGCQDDSQCWADTIATCEGLLSDFVAADPVGMLNAIHADLEAAGMLRDGDVERRAALQTYLESRIAGLPIELELNRPGPYYNYCEAPYVSCGEGCALPGDCVPCEPTDNPDAGGEPPIGEGGAAGAAPLELRVAPDEDGAADIALPEPFPPPPPPNGCVDPVEEYGPGVPMPIPF